MAKTLREVIRNTVHYHLKKKKGLVFGQCLTAVGWVGGTLPHLTEKDGMIDLSMADVANGGIVAGAGLSGRDSAIEELAFDYSFILKITNKLNT